ncbi:hypothetical protein OSH76_25260, partial [Mycobacterium ulcerans]
QPPPRPPQPTIPQLTSLLINNAGALPSFRRCSRNAMGNGHFRFLSALYWANHQRIVQKPRSRRPHRDTLRSGLGTVAVRV